MHILTIKIIFRKESKLHSVERFSKSFRNKLITISKTVIISTIITKLLLPEVIKTTTIFKKVCESLT